MNEEQFWISVWKIIGATFVAFVATLSGCVMHENYLVSEAIKAGATPIAASCSIKGFNGYAGAAICSQVAK